MFVNQKLLTQSRFISVNLAKFLNALKLNQEYLLQNYFGILSILIFTMGTSNQQNTNQCHIMCDHNCGQKQTVCLAIIAFGACSNF